VCLTVGVCVVLCCVRVSHNITHHTQERDRLRKTVIRTNKWPINKRDSIRRHYKEFTNFINKIKFDILNVE